MSSNLNTFQREKLLKVKDVQEIIGCGKSRAYELFQQKDFPKIVIGKRYYILESEFYGWLKRYTGREYKL